MSSDQEIDLTNEIDEMSASFEAEQTRHIILCDPLGNPLPGFHLGTPREAEQLASFNATTLWIQTVASVVLLIGVIAWSFLR